MLNIVVQKYGGSSLADVQKLKTVAQVGLSGLRMPVFRVVVAVSPRGIPPTNLLGQG